MQETRQQIVEILKVRDHATVDELSSELGLTTVTIRHHLDVLRKRGLVAPPKTLRKGGPGRPQHLYQLAEKAEDLFPKSYDRLAEAVLAEIESKFTSDEMDELADAVAEQLASQFQIPEDADFTTRIEEALGFLNDIGYLAILEEEEEGYQIRIAHCPYGQIAKQHPVTCEIGARMLALLTGVERDEVERISEEPARCIYLFRPGE